MKKYSVFSPLLVVLFSLFFGFPTHALAQAATVVKINPEIQSLSIGQTATMSVDVGNVQNLYAFDITISYDPTIISVVSIEKSTFLQAGFEAAKSIDNVNGKVQLAFTQLPPAESKSGDGSLISIKIKAVKAGSTNLEIKDLQLATPDGQLIAYTSQKSSIAVTGDSTSSSVITNPSDQDIAETTLPNLPTVEATSALVLQPTNSATTIIETANPTQQPMAVATAQTSRATSTANTNAAVIYFSIGGVLLLLIGFFGGNLVRKMLNRK